MPQDWHYGYFMWCGWTREISWTMCFGMLFSYRLQYQNWRTQYCQSLSYSLTVLTIVWDTVLWLVSPRKWVSSSYLTQLPCGESSSKSRRTAIISGTSLPSSAPSSSTIHAGLARAVKWNFVARCCLRLYSGNANKSTKQLVGTLSRVIKVYQECIKNNVSTCIPM